MPHQFDRSVRHWVILKLENGHVKDLLFHELQLLRLRNGYVHAVLVKSRNGHSSYEISVRDQYESSLRVETQYRQ